MRTPKYSETEIKKAEQIVWNMYRKKLKLPPCDIPKERTDFRKLALDYLLLK